MGKMLAMDPADRITALQCLSHPYFDGMRDAETENMIKST